jgi:hypothetical protein
LLSNSRLTLSIAALLRKFPIFEPEDIHKLAPRHSFAGQAIQELRRILVRPTRPLGFVNDHLSQD